MELNITYGSEHIGLPLKINISDLEPEVDLFGLFYTELLKDAFSQQLTSVYLDLSLIFQAEISDCLNAVYGMHKLYALHKTVKVQKHIGIFTSEQLSETRSVILNLSIVQRTLLLSIMHFICSERMLDVCYKVFAETLIGLDEQQIKTAVGITN